MEVMGRAGGGGFIVAEVFAWGLRVYDGAGGRTGELNWLQ